MGCLSERIVERAYYRIWALEGGSKEMRVHSRLIFSEIRDKSMTGYLNKIFFIGRASWRENKAVTGKEIAVPPFSQEGAVFGSWFGTQ